MHTNISKLGISLKSSYYSIYNTASKEINYMYPKNIISNYINVLFEGHEFMAMSGYHDYLKIDYGDYMTPPPIEKRLPKHH
jgi:lipopolysaccharide cholinephosphotransferase